MIGQTLAHYKILEKIGSGGMGDVYLAEDTKLDRKVALKVLPPELAESEERRARFKREAKAIAALDHPNIIQVFSVEEAEGIHFITMQLVHGKTLTELLPKNGYPLNKFFEIAIPLADAVAAAHQEGITHRDLKPDNLMVDEDGRIKVLDFGLAKPTSGFVGGDADSALPTAAKTAEGVIVGTLNYMSPEQAEGKTVDFRSDIFSLGIMFFEMLTGERPFRGDTATSVLSSIIKDTPESVTNLKPGIPRELAKIVRRCLTKEQTRRFQSALDLRNDLEETKQDLESGEAVAGTVPAKIRHNQGSKGLWLAGAVIALVAAWMIWPHGDSSQEPIPRFTNPVQLTAAVGVEDYPTWSSDGGRLAYQSNQSGNSDIWVAQVGKGQPVNRTADYTGADRFPSWSPDGSEIAFWSGRDGGGYFVMLALGGAARKVIPDTRISGLLRESPPQWSGDGDELAGVGADSTGVFVEIVSISTRESRRVRLPGRRRERMDLSWSPDGRFFAVVDAIRITNDLGQLWVLRLADGEAFQVTDGVTKVLSPSWSSDGRSLYFVSNRGGGMDLWEQPLGPDGEPEGNPRAVTAGIGIRHAAFSPDGTKLAYSRGRLVANVWRVPILDDRLATWADAEQLTFEQAFVEYFDVSPDGTQLMLSSDRSGNPDLWMLPLAGGEMMQVTSDPTPDWYPRWSPDGQEIAFYSYRSGNREVWLMPVSGGPARQLTDGNATGTESWFPSWSPDGRELAFRASQDVIENLYVMPREGGDARQVTNRPGPNRYPIWSPDGESLVFQSNDFLWKVPSAGGEAERLTDGPGRVPRWSRDGRQVFFIGGERSGNVWALSLEDKSEHALANLVGKRGRMYPDGLATDGQYVYFTWQEDLGDIWVMDVVTDETE